jgi:TRAP-type uncharacterized transport system fused permease subunit
MKEEGGSRFRELNGPTKIYADTLLILMPIVGITGILNIPAYFGFTIHLQQFIAFIFGLVLSSSFILIPARKGMRKDFLPWYDLIFSIIMIIAGLYIAINYETIMVDVGITMTHRVILGILAVLLTIESSRGSWAAIYHHYSGVSGVRPFCISLPGRFSDQKYIS